jgi:Transposase, Mutator family
VCERGLAPGGGAVLHHPPDPRVVPVCLQAVLARARRADLKPIYTAPTVAAAAEALDAVEEKWGKPYPAIPRLWRSSWELFTPFLDN